MIDEIDLKIIKELEGNSKLTFKEIGEKLYLSGQAVGMRVNKLIENEVIKNFTINVDNKKLGITSSSYIKIYMKDNNHKEFLELVNKYDEIKEAHKVISDACYIIKVEVFDEEVLQKILDEILTFANYQVSVLLSKIK